MAADLFVDRFAGFKTPAWHKLGTVFDRDLTATEAFEVANLTYDTKLCPYYVRTPWGSLAAKREGKLALVREPTPDDPQPRQFAVVDQGYGLVTNRQLAQLLDPLSQVWPVETAGALGRGERTFLTLRVGGTEVKGEELKEYFLVNQCQDGTGGINLAYTTVRVVCANTLAVALEGGATNVRHTRRVRETLAFEVDVLAALRQHRESTLRTIERLAERRVTSFEAETVIKAALPYPKQTRAFRFAGLTPDDVGKTLYVAERERAQQAEGGYQWKVSRVDEFRAAARQLYVRLNDEAPRIAGTAWAAVNAITELADHRAGRDKAGKASAASALFGERAGEKARAFAAAVALL